MITALSNRLLAFSRKQRLAPETVDLNTLVAGRSTGEQATANGMDYVSKQLTVAKLKAAL